MAHEAKLEAIMEALKLADDTTSSFLDRETGEVHMLNEEELSLAEVSETELDQLPEWEQEVVMLARRIREGEGTRYLRLPSKFDVHEWAIMDRFSQSIENARVRDDLRSGIHGAGAFRMFKRLLDEYDLWDSWRKFKEDELRRMAIEWCEEHGIAYREK